MFLTSSAELNYRLKSYSVTANTVRTVGVYILDFVTCSFPHERNNTATNASLCRAALVLVRNSIKFIVVIDSRTNQYVFAQQRVRVSTSRNNWDKINIYVWKCAHACKIFIKLGCQQHLGQCKVMPSQEPDVIWSSSTWDFFWCVWSAQYNSFNSFILNRLRTYKIQINLFYEHCMRSRDGNHKESIDSSSDFFTTTLTILLRRKYPSKSNIFYIYVCVLFYI